MRSIFIFIFSIIFWNTVIASTPTKQYTGCWLSVDQKTNDQYYLYLSIINTDSAHTLLTFDSYDDTTYSVRNLELPGLARDIDQSGSHFVRFEDVFYIKDGMLHDDAVETQLSNLEHAGSEHAAGATISFTRFYEEYRLINPSQMEVYQKTASQLSDNDKFYYYEHPIELVDSYTKIAETAAECKILAQNNPTKLLKRKHPLIKLK